MAFGVGISGYPEAGDEPLWSVETPWWNTDELTYDPRFKDASWCPGYADYEAVVTPDEAKRLSANYAPNATMDHFKTRMNNLDRKLSNRDGRLDRVQITVFEWGSGF